MSETAPTKNRATSVAFGVLGVAVALGAVLLGAPLRFSSGDAGPAWLRDFLTSLGPVALVEAAAAAAIAWLVATECAQHGAPGLPGGRRAACGSRSGLPRPPPDPWLASQFLIGAYR